MDLVGEQEGTDSEGTETGEEEENERGNSNDEESDAPPQQKWSPKKPKNCRTERD